jgi:hypothetical protein
MLVDGIVNGVPLTPPRPFLCTCQHRPFPIKPDLHILLHRLGHGSATTISHSGIVHRPAYSFFFSLSLGKMVFVANLALCFIPCSILVGSSPEIQRLNACKTCWANLISCSTFMLSQWTQSQPRPLAAAPICRRDLLPSHWGSWCSNLKWRI